MNEPDRIEFFVSYYSKGKFYSCNIESNNVPISSSLMDVIRENLMKKGKHKSLVILNLIRMEE